MATDCDDDQTNAYTSPPCFLHEVDPAYGGLAPTTGLPAWAVFDGRPGMDGPEPTGKDDVQRKLVLPISDGESADIDGSRTFRSW